MVTLHRGPNWKIAVYAAEHGIPHFHIEGPGFRASVAIATLEVIVGRVPRQVLVAALDWALSNQADLLGKWRELNP
ncbi:DUF4160 domain-containing protein [Novosphingobium sp.]|uniref:DUF4160 domain-containing protein n=1 Tax=Novosphingobium sp. TaxID=1874826 RepID=UPI0025D3DFC6|nr:DUF4160 domain-containing protein [Novosphingobium sp.]MCC6926323.1 DUF4160 domain-containing protein [Novosphingobium sp.]